MGNTTKTYDGVYLSIDAQESKDKLVSRLINLGYKSLADEYNDALHDLFVSKYHKKSTCEIIEKSAQLVSIMIEIRNVLYQPRARYEIGGISESGNELRIEPNGGRSVLPITPNKRI